MTSCKYLLRLALAAIVTVSFGACNHNAKDELAHHHHHNHEQAEDEHEHHDHEGHEGHDHEGHHHEGEEAEHEGHNHAEAEAEHEGVDEITLSPETATRFGVATDTVRPGDFSDVIKVSGRIMPDGASTALVVAPIPGIVTFGTGINAGAKVSRGTAVATVRADRVSGGNANAAAAARLAAAKRELDRIKPLWDDRLVTADVYNNAVAEYEQAQALYSAGAANGRAISPITGVITSLDIAQGQYVNAGDPIATVSSSTKLTLRADVPQSKLGAIAGIKDARIELPYRDAPVLLSAVNGRRTAAELSTADNGAYVPVYFTFDNDGTVVAGSTATVYLLGAAKTGRLSVPRSALSEQQGDYFVFERLDDECYRKVLVTIGESDGERVAILSGLKGGEVIVTEGVTTVRLAQSSNVVPEGHSHNH